MQMENELSRQQRRRLRTRELLKQSAAELLVERGYDALTIADITDRVDLARATFYVHFRDKDDAIWAVLHEHFEALAQAVEDARTDENTDYQTWHRTKILRVFQFVFEHQALLRVMLGERGHIRLTRRLSQYLAMIIEGDLALENTASKQLSDHTRAYLSHFLAGAMMQMITVWLERLAMSDGSAETPLAMGELFYRLEMKVREER